MKKQFVILLIMIFSFYLMPIIVNASGVPSITSISPEIMTANDNILTINGTGFGDMKNYGFGVKIVPDNGKLYIGETSYCGTGDCPFSTTLENWTDSKIKIHLLLPGRVSFKKDNFDIVYGPYVYKQPEITSINISTAIAGDELILKSSWSNDFQTVIPDYKDATNFGASIFFNNVEGIIKSISAETIVTTVPQNAKSGNIKLVYKHNGKTIETIGPYLEILQPTAQDDLSAYQQYLQQTKVDQAWNYTHGSSEVVVAVIDDGVYTGHPDLDSNMWINFNEIEGNGKDDDSNGYIDDRWGWDFISNSKDMTTLGTHGTMVAGIIGAESNNTTGISGINWNVKLMPIIACNDTSCSDDAIKKGIKYAVDNGANIINLSLAGKVFNYLDDFNDIIKYAFDRNVLVVVAAGNGDLEGGIGRNLDITKVSPVCNDGGQNMVLGIGAVDANNKITSWSNYGGCVDIYAPGENIVSTAVPAYSTLSGFYDSADGTSFATPIVSGIAALIKAKYPTIKNTAIRDRIINNSDYQNGVRVVNAYKAISQTFTDNEKNINNEPTPTPTSQNINNNTTANNSTEKQQSTVNGKSIDKNLQNRLKGYILLQVESAGEAWYVNPTDGKRYYMKDGATAYQMMRNFSLGITNADLAKMPQENERNNYPSLVNRLKGKILLQVEANGEAWYVNPKNGYRYYMKDGEAAYNLMRYYSLGITNKDLEKIPSGSL